MHLTISPTGLSPPTVGLPRPFGYHDLSIMKVLQPRINPVWALPTSLAATTGIDFSFFSSRYLDVSVPRVVLPPPMCSAGGYAHCCAWVRPFGDPRVEGCVLLAGDYRSLPRPSSAPCAKASAVRPWYLAGPHRARGISTCR